MREPGDRARRRCHLRRKRAGRCAPEVPSARHRCCGEGTLYVTASEGHLHAIQTDVGRVRWKFKAGGPDSFHSVAERQHGAVWVRRRQTVRGERRLRHKSVGSGDRGRSMGVAGGAAGDGVLRKRRRTHVCAGSADGKRRWKVRTRRTSVFDGVCSGERDLCGMRRWARALPGRGDGKEFCGTC